MTERKVKIEDPVNGDFYGKWVDTIVWDNVPAAVIVTDEGKVYGVEFRLLTVLP